MALSEAHFRAVLDQLRDTVDLAKKLSIALQEEYLQSAMARNEHRLQIEQLRQNVGDLERAVVGDGGASSMLFRLTRIEEKLTALRDDFDRGKVERQEGARTRRDRVWGFINQNAVSLLTPVGLFVWWLIDQLRRAP